jgi:hypothetical protein
MGSHFAVDTIFRQTCNGDGSGHTPEPFLITGRNLAHAHRDAGERAGIAAQLILGEATLIKPTIVQTAAIARVCIPYIQTALHLKAATRLRVATGTLSLVDAAKANGLLVAWLAASSDEKAALGSIVGVDAIWDSVISPAI